MDYVAIDFETANSQRSSPCAVGVIVVKGGEVAEKFYTLIKPMGCRFDGFNIGIHGITPKDVENQPEFPEIWPDLKLVLESDIVIAHNASFDMSVLRRTLALYELPFPNMTYSCTLAIAEKTWPDFSSYRLSAVTRKLAIEFEHHHALEDAWACSEIARHACKEKNSTNLDELLKTIGLRHGRIKAGHSGVVDIKAVRASTNDFDAEHPFYKRVCVFTGTLQSTTRAEAMQDVVDVGGKAGKSVTKATNFLVLGEQDFRQFAKGQTKSSKVRKAESLVAKGQDIEIISEEDFFQRLGG